MEHYDIALSFAGEDREHARALAKALVAAGVRVFFDEYERDRLWGEDLYTYLTDLYQNRSRYVVLLLSKHYATKLWTTHERRAAQARAFQENRAYILPIRLDDSEVEGILPTVAYERWPDDGPSSLVPLILRKLGVLVNSRDGAEMIFIPAGKFLMGNDNGPPNQQPRRSVHLSSYYIYKKPVTLGQYRRFCQETGAEPASTHGFRATDEHPVVNVSWHEAQRYCQWAGVHLPSEAQWEKAARGTDGRLYPWGDHWDDDACEWRRYLYQFAGAPSRVGAFPWAASPYGAQDMVGNVWEWCADWYDSDYYSIAPDIDPRGPDRGGERVCRGCGWADMVEFFPLNFSCAFRDCKPPHFTYVLWGFRCVLGERTERNG